MVRYCLIQDRPMLISFLSAVGRIFSIVSAVRTFYSHSTHPVMNVLICVGDKKLRYVLIIITYYLVQIPRSLTIILNIFIDFQPEDLWSIDSQKK